MTDGELLDMDAKQEVERMAKKLDKMVTKKNTVWVHMLLGVHVCVCVLCFVKKTVTCMLICHQLLFLIPIIVSFKKDSNQSINQSVNQSISGLSKRAQLP